ncbi:MAG: 3'-5' exonuclease [Gammaproteobacteria bacterium]|nr:3'-5' exonuclease [Gammaproteobacteria bacterium]
MSLIAVLDTETTGFARNDYTSPDNPYLASLALLLYDMGQQRVQASFNTMILPEDWEMPIEASAINGLDTETLTNFGVPLTIALPVVFALLEPAELFVAHNAAFDAKVFAAAFYRAQMEPELDMFLQMDTYCTMAESKQIVQAKNVKGHIKNPKLTEAYEFFFDTVLDNAHSANADTVACLEIYLAIQAHNAEAADSEVSL